MYDPQEEGPSEAEVFESHATLPCPRCGCVDLQYVKMSGPGGCDCSDIICEAPFGNDDDICGHVFASLSCKPCSDGDKADYLRHKEREA